MADPYRLYGAPADRASVPRSSFPGYFSSEAHHLASHSLWGSNDLSTTSSDHLQTNPGALYGFDYLKGIGVRPEISSGVLTTGASIQQYSSHDDPYLVSQRQSIPPGISPSIPDIANERPTSFRHANGLPLSAKESNILFVDGLPNDCTRREVGHLFRPFIGYKDIKVVHKEPRRSGDKAMTLCFVEFNDAKCALTALEALQGYKFDDKKSGSPALKIHFAHFPFRLPLDHDEQRIGVPR